MQYHRLDEWLKDILVCPRDHNRLTRIGDDILACPSGHKYPIVDDIPIMLLRDKTSTQPEIVSTGLEKGERYRNMERREETPKSKEPDLDYLAIEPYVQEVIGATCGIMYARSVKKLSRYPIPRLPLDKVKKEEKYFLDVGCNWGRWSIAASLLGYNTIGIDHNLCAIQAAHRVARQLGIKAHYLVADARYLPFAESFFNVVFSYSVFQHFSSDDVEHSLSEIQRVLRISELCLIQMPNKFGIRNLSNQLKRGFREAKDFEVRYWGPAELKNIFKKHIGTTSILVDGFFSLNAQAACKDMLSVPQRLIVRCSEALKLLSAKINLLKYCADSLYVKATKK